MLADSHDWILIVGLVAYVFASEIMHMIHVNKLVNKLMSRNYHDYVFNQNIERTMDTEHAPPRVDTELPEDLGPLNSFGAN